MTENKKGGVSPHQVQMQGNSAERKLFVLKSNFNILQNKNSVVSVSTIVTPKNLKFKSMTRGIQN